MKVTVLYFATLRDRAGLRREKMTIPEGSTVADLMDNLRDRSDHLAEAMDHALVAVNREYAFREEELHDGDEVALFPPVSGGNHDSPPTILQITSDPLDLNDILGSIILPTTGAACCFTGMVRAYTNREKEKVTAHLEYEAYEPMAEAKMRQIVDEIRERWPSVEGIAIAQRLGSLDPGTPSVIIACAASHRDTGVFEAARYGIDRLKQIVPIWKKEIASNGHFWVEGDYRPSEEDKKG